MHLYIDLQNQTVMPSFNLNDKRFRLLENSANGAVTDDTTFHYSQKDDVITAIYSGGGVMDGQVMATWGPSGQLEMRYHCIMDDHTLKAGKALADALLNDSGLIELHLDWEWLGDTLEKGNSVYIEIP